MDLTFIRQSESRYVTHVLRGDGVALEVPGHDRPSPIPHDLAHYVVERELGLKGGFWGRVAAGAIFPGMKVLSGRQPPHASSRSDAVRRKAGQQGTEAEVLVGVFIKLTHQELDPSHPAAQARLRGYWRPSKPTREPPTVEEARRICAELRTLQEEWECLAVSESLTVSWPENLVLSVK